MAAALRAVRRLQATSPARILPPSLTRPSPKLSAAALASSLPYARGAHSTQNPAPSILRRYCSAARGERSAADLASVRRADASPVQAPSLLPVRHHGTTTTSTQAPASTKLNSLEQCSKEEAVQSAFGKLRNIDKSLAQLKQYMWCKFVLLGMFLHVFYRLFSRLNQDVVALGKKVEKLESRRILERKIVQRSDSC